MGSVDVVLIGVKLWDTEAAAHAVSAIVGPTTAVLSLQNGVQKDDVLRDILGSEPVLGGVCYIASTIVRPGIISHTGTVQKLVVGEYDGRREERAEAFLEACRRGGIDVELSLDVRKAIWGSVRFSVCGSFLALLSNTKESCSNAVNWSRRDRLQKTVGSSRASCE